MNTVSHSQPSEMLKKKKQNHTIFSYFSLVILFRAALIWNVTLSRNTIKFLVGIKASCLTLGEFDNLIDHTSSTVCV